MDCRELGKTGIEVGAIGFGTEHLPPDADTIAEIVETAVDGGANFIDVLQIDPAGDGAYVWNGLGPMIREHRDTLVLACHWGIGYLYDLDSCKRTFPEALAHVGNGFIDVAMMTMVGEPGRTGAWLDVLMFAVNMTQQGDERQQSLYQACAEHGVGLIAMKPYSAGLLLRVGGEPTSITPLQCLDYVLRQPVATVVPGVRNADELRAALLYETASAAEKDHTSALEAVHRELAGHCVHCRRCMPCAKGIDITAIVAMVGWARGGVQDGLRGMYANQQVKPSACDGRGVCMASCDFDVDSVGVMRRAVELFET